MTVEIPRLIPEFPQEGFIEKQQVKNCLKEYAAKNNFVITIQKAEARRIVFKCQKGGFYRNTRHITTETRKRKRTSSQIGCPFKVRVSFRKKSGRYFLLSPNNPEEYTHNHLLGKEDSKRQNSAICNHMGSFLKITEADSLKHGGLEQQIDCESIENKKKLELDDKYLCELKKLDNQKNGSCIDIFKDNEQFVKELNQTRKLLEQLNQPEKKTPLFQKYELDEHNVYSGEKS